MTAYGSLSIQSGELRHDRYHKGVFGMSKLALPLSYSISNKANGFSATVLDANGVVLVTNLYEEQAAELVNSCNNHAQLVAALRHARLGYTQLQNLKAHKATAAAMLAVIDTALREAGA